MAIDTRDYLTPVRELYGFDFKNLLDKQIRAHVELEDKDRFHSLICENDILSGQEGGGLRAFEINQHLYHSHDYRDNDDSRAAGNTAPAGSADGALEQDLHILHIYMGNRPQSQTSLASD